MWPAIDKWKNMTYLEEMFGGQSLMITRLDRGNGTGFR